jgi:DNA-binding transcriptional ArsR family regulator
VDAFVAVAEPTRRRLLDELLHGESSVGELVDRLGMNQPTVSKHLRVLKDAGLVISRVDAQRRYYRVEPAGLEAIDSWIASYRRLWAGRLDALEAHLAHEEHRD